MNNEINEKIEFCLNIFFYLPFHIFPVFSFCSKNCELESFFFNFSLF